jgi:dihydroorotase
VTAVKLYPAGATTNSASGVRDFDKVRPVLETMAEIGLPLCVHGEVTDAGGRHLRPRGGVHRQGARPDPPRDPGLRVVMEHITTSDGVDYVAAGGGDIAGTITTHHLIINRNHILVGGIRPHYYCLPVAKRETHRWRCAPPRPRAIRASSSAPTARRMWTRSRNTPAAAPAVLGHQHAVLPRRCVRGGGRARPAGGLHLAERPRLLRAAPERETITLTRGDPGGGTRDKIDTGDGPVTVFDPGHPAALAV